MKQTKTARFLLLACSLLVSLVLCEIILRLRGPLYYMQPMGRERDAWRGLLHQPSSTPGLIYEMTPNATKNYRGMNIVTNSYGMRGPEPKAGPESPEVRIAVLGDSVSFGWGVQEEQAWPGYLRSWLNSRGSRRYDVLNFSVCEYNTVDEVVVLKQKALQWKPQVVIIGYVLNDPDTDPRGDLHQAFVKPKLYQHSYFLRFLAQTKLSWQTARYGDYYLFQHLDPSKWARLTEGFAEIRQAAEGAGARVVLLIFPRLPRLKETWESYPYAGLHERVARLARSNGFGVIDLLVVFRRESPDDLRLNLNDRTHPNARGHALAARAVADFLQKMESVPESGGQPQQEKKQLEK